MAAAEAKAARLRKQMNASKRKAATHQKIVIGAAVLAGMRDDAEFRGRVVAVLRQNVTRDVDRGAVAELLTGEGEAGVGTALPRGDYRPE